MREGVVASFIFFILGMLLILVAAKLLPEIWYLTHIVMFLGFMLLLFSPIILISTFLLSVLPKAKEEMDNCDH